ncbi:response regulator [Patescibacteria group bacterium]|nr:response regulator [Patescibacteria group bacterium]MBU1890320.1 response regulator [Patescibacteria group bacterium]
MANKLKVLLVEDEKMLSSMYATKFTKEGYDLSAAYDGEEGLAKAKSLKPDIILLDIIMPKIDGFVVLKALKEDPELKKIPVILLTNLGQDEDIKKGKELGACDYFIKANHTPAEVVEKVQSVFEK